MDLPPSTPDLLFPLAAFLDRARVQYADDVRWRAPRRGLVIDGREPLLALLCAEAAAMRAVELQPLRRAVAGGRLVDESVVRFIYAGYGIAGLDQPAGTRVELGRVRLLELRDGRVQGETCIETYTPLAPADGSPTGESMAPRGRFAAGG